MQEYINIFVDKEYSTFIDKYLNTKTLKRLKHITQFCGCDYTSLYSPLFLYTRFDHSLVVAHIVWHFSHDLTATIVALLHDAGTPCFAHTIDCVLGDYKDQESSERSIVDIVKKDEELLKMLKQDSIPLEELDNLLNYPILENKSPKLCADRLDGVLHTCYVGLHTHRLDEIKEVFNDLCVLKNETGKGEIGFKHKKYALKFVKMVYTYAKELQGNTDKYVMTYISELIKRAFDLKLINMDDLYEMKEEEIIRILKSNFTSWESFVNAKKVISTKIKPNQFCISIDTKKRNTIPLVQTKAGNVRIDSISKEAKEIYSVLNKYKDLQYAYIPEIEEI